MELQEIFETVCRHLAKQNAQAYVDNVGCMYRSPGGKMCAVGCLIKDEYYTDTIEDLLVTAPEVLNVLEASGIKMDIVEVDLLKGMQRVHDRYKTFVDDECVLSALDALAVHHGLDFLPEQWGLKTNA